MGISKYLRLMTAKSGSNNSNLWLPFYYHCEDTARVIKNLWEKHYESISKICGLPENVMKKTVILLAYLHDMGKLTCIFQYKILLSLPQIRSIVEHYKIDISGDFLGDDVKNTYHAVCGEAILRKMDLPEEFCSIVGSHHGMPANKKVVREYIKNKLNPDKANKKDSNIFYGHDIEFWNNLWREWLEYSLEKSGFFSIDQIPKLSRKAQVLLSGLLITADWIASNQELFKLIDCENIPEDYPEERAVIGLEKFGLTEKWTSDNANIDDERFKDIFSFAPNNIQKEILKKVDECKDAGIFIIEAPMGTGKTEAALASAQILAQKKNKNGVFFGLPTQATANGIFERVENWAEKQSKECYHSIKLLHKNAGFQPAFSKLPKETPIINDEDSNGLIVHSFFNGNKQACLADFVVSTVDHLLMMALKKKHIMLSHLGLSQKVVIIDECHAYDAYMNEYLDTALAWLGAYRVPVILLSATLPIKRREELVRAYFNLDEDEFEQDISKEDYPLLTFTDGENVNQCKLPYKAKSHEIKIISINEQDMLKKVEEVVKNGGCVGIICNTVAKAQRFSQLAREIEGANVILYHAQYILSDRAKKEEEILKTAGKHSDYISRKDSIIIGTQVLEQSLDIDFDLIVTDLCPMDLLIQRIGRLHRHIRPDRPIKQAECLVLGNNGEFEKSSEYIYGRWLLMRTSELIPEKIIIPDDISVLVQKTYKEIEPKNDKQKKALNEYNFDIEKKQCNAKAFIMRKPIEGKSNNTLHGWLDIGVNENQALASVRGGISSIEVILLKENSDRTLSFIGSNEKININNLDEEECKIIAQQKIRLPSMFCQGYNINCVIEELERKKEQLKFFDKSYYLKGELFLLLDKNMTAVLNGYTLSYNDLDGLSYSKNSFES